LLLHAAGLCGLRAHSRVMDMGAAVSVPAVVTRLVEAPAARSVSAQAVEPRPSPSVDTGGTLSAHGVTEGTASTPIRYYSPEEVDERLHPQEEWLLHLEALLPLERHVVAFTVWVSADGVIQRWQLVRQVPPGPWSQALLADLQRTPMIPAIRQGTAVAAQASFELTLDTH